MGRKKKTETINVAPATPEKPVKEEPTGKAGKKEHKVREGYEYKA